MESDLTRLRVGPMIDQSLITVPAKESALLCRSAFLFLSRQTALLLLERGIESTNLTLFLILEVRYHGEEDY